MDAAVTVATLEFTASPAQVPAGHDPVDGEEQPDGDEEPPERAADHRPLHVMCQLAAGSAARQQPVCGMRDLPTTVRQFPRVSTTGAGN
jgi:hypothetical protein